MDLERSLRLLKQFFSTWFDFPHFYRLQRLIRGPDPYTNKDEGYVVCSGAYDNDLKYMNTLHGQKNYPLGLPLLCATLHLYYFRNIPPRVIYGIDSWVLKLENGKKKLGI